MIFNIFIKQNKQNKITALLYLSHQTFMLAVFLLDRSSQEEDVSRRWLSLWGSVYLVETDDVGVLQQLHDLHLSEDLFQVLIIQLGLIHYFYRHLR